ncbi:MAG: hypothetical protein LUB59_06380 [Candidatus Gastranaerophilales bacterium]|nr:hypothetical protein [Candidatus Gastranaerophilales bacterium]
MYVNKCIKCGAEFETKNPKRVICPNCLYSEKNAEESTEDKQLKSYSSYTTEERRENAPRQYDSNRRYDNNRGDNRSFNNRRYDNNRNDNRGGYQQRRNFSNNYNNQGGGYNRNQQGGYNRQGGYGSQGDNRGGYQQRRPNNRFQQGGNRRPNNRPKKQAKPLLISKEQLEKIEALYKTMLPLPNPDAHETIGAHLEIEPRKVFFGINLVRQKLMLPKLPFPKRKLAVTPDQMTAIKSLYTPLLPLPPIGCHKIIAAQLRVDEWRVHVAIKLIRAQMGLDRWNEDRPDKPADYMVPKYPKKEAGAPETTAAGAEENPEPKQAETTAVQAEEKPEPEQAEAGEEPAVETPKKRGRKKKEETTETTAVSEEAQVEETPKKRGRKPKKTEDE